ncbi:S1 family peptidase [Candidatus Phytoplasma solani]|uniref:S1 family peptidase n=1 Tax=Candidatus Phytoplasma solani TaxID=69896 RepID=UPI0032DAB7EC
MINYPQKEHTHHNDLPSKNIEYSEKEKKIDEKIKELEPTEKKLKGILKEEEQKKSENIKKQQKQLCLLQITNNKKTLGVVIHQEINELQEEKQYWIITPKTTDNQTQDNVIIQLQNQESLDNKEQGKLIQGQDRKMPAKLKNFLKDFDIITFKSKKVYEIISLDSQNVGKKYFQGQILYSFVMAPLEVIAFQESYVSEEISKKQQDEEIQIPVYSRNHSQNQQTIFFTEEGKLIGFLIPAQNKNEKGIKYLKVIPPIEQTTTNNYTVLNASDSSPFSHFEKDLNTVTVCVNTGFSLGTGIIVKKKDSDNYYVLTNRHVIKTFFYESLKLLNNINPITLTNKNLGLKEVEAKLFAFIRNNREYDDIAILTFKMDSEENKNKIDSIINKYIDFNENIKIPITQGEEVYALGCQKGLQETKKTISFIEWFFQLSHQERNKYKKNLFKQGIISYFNEREINSDMTLDPGNSGGPLFNSKGKLIGMNKSYYKDVRISQSINLNHIKKQFYSILNKHKQSPQIISFESPEKESSITEEKIKYLSKNLEEINVQIILEDLLNLNQKTIDFKRKNNLFKNKILTIQLHGLETLQFVACNFEKYEHLEISWRYDSETNIYFLTSKIYIKENPSIPIYEENIGIKKENINKLFLVFNIKNFSYDNLLNKKEEELKLNANLIEEKNITAIIKKEILQTLVLCQNHQNNQNPSLGVIINKENLNDKNKKFLYTVLLQKSDIINLISPQIKITIQTPYGLQDEEGNYQYITTPFNHFSYITFVSNKNYPIAKIKLEVEEKKLLGETIYLISDCNDVSDKALAPHIFQSHLATEMNQEKPQIMVDTTFLKECFNPNNNEHYNNWFIFNSQGNLINVCDKKDIATFNKQAFPFIVFPQINMTSPNPFLSVNWIKIYIFSFWAFLCATIFIIIDYQNQKKGKYYL